MAGGRGRPRKTDKAQPSVDPAPDKQAIGATPKPKRGRPKKIKVDDEEEAVSPAVVQETAVDKGKIIADGGDISGAGKSDVDEEERAAPQKLKVRRRPTKSSSDPEVGGSSGATELSPVKRGNRRNATQGGQDASDEPEKLASIHTDDSSLENIKRRRGRPKKSGSSDQKAIVAGNESENAASPKGKSIPSSPGARRGPKKRQKLEDAAAAGASSPGKSPMPATRPSTRSRNGLDVEPVAASSVRTVHFDENESEQKSPSSRRGNRRAVQEAPQPLAMRDPLAQESATPDTMQLPGPSSRKAAMSDNREPAGVADAGLDDVPADGSSGQKRKDGRRKKVRSPEELEDAPSSEKAKKVTRAKSKELANGGSVFKMATRKKSLFKADDVEPKVKRKRGRPKKSETEKVEVLKKKQKGMSSSEYSSDGSKKRKRGRPKSTEKVSSPARPKRSGTAGTAGGKSPKGEKRGRKPSKSLSPMKSPGISRAAKKKYLKTIELDGEEFHVGEDVYVTKSEGGVSESESELEDCRICGSVDEQTMVECDGCLAGYHLKCMDPPLDSVPEGDWLCSFCAAGEKPPQSKRGHRNARERFLASELWAARIERMWKESDGTHWFTAHWYIVPEETALGRQEHNGRREIFRSNRRDDNEMDSILRHCSVLPLEEFKKADVGDDVYCCQYEYNEQYCKFKRIDDFDEKDNAGDDAYDESKDESGESDDDDEDGTEGKPGGRKSKRFSKIKAKNSSGSSKAANKRHNYSGGLEKVGAKTTPNLTRRPQTDFDHAKAALALSAIPSSLPCRDKEREEISAFLRDSIAEGEMCLGKCLYISGVPGTGKTATVMEVIKELDKKVELGELPSYRFIEVNGLRLPSPEHAYTVIHESLTGQHVSSKQALQLLDERFSNGEALKGPDSRPCVLLVDELDVLVNRNQSVLYNIFDWPSRPQSRLIVIGIANTIDLPERLLPRIASRMGVQRISFSPYTHVELEKILSARLTGAQVFEKQAAEFIARKVAAVSGDIRRALELCRKSVENAEARLAKPAGGESSSAGTTAQEASGSGTNANGNAKASSVSLKDVEAAIAEMFDAPQIQLMRRSAKLWKVFLTAMVHQHKTDAAAETTFEKVAATCSEICVSNGEASPDTDTLLDIGLKLGASRLILCEPGALHRLQKLQLNVSCEDVNFALRNDEEIPWLAKYL